MIPRKLKLRFLFLFGICLALFGFFALRRYLGLNSTNGLESSEPVILTTPEVGDVASTQPEQAVNNDDSLREIDVQLVASNLEVPWALAFTSPTRILVTERPGRVRVIENGSLRSEPLLSIPAVSSKSEEGLMGLTLHPDYDNNKFFYVCYAYPQGKRLVDRVEQYRDDGLAAVRVATIIDNIPAAQFHSGCELGFGPDGKLYISTGDATDKNLAQRLDSLAGKILRLEADGSVPTDNPFPGSAVWSLGHRNPQGFDWLVNNGQVSLFAAEHGPSGFDGPGGGDEVNLITKGQNYGWPTVSHLKSQPGLVDPLLVFTPAVAPGSLIIYDGETASRGPLAMPQFANNLFFAMLKGEGITRVVLDQADPSRVIEYQRLPQVAFGRIRELQIGPDGAIYFTTSNRDGRGTIRPGDDKIYKIVPK